MLLVRLLLLLLLLAVVAVQARDAAALLRRRELFLGSSGSGPLLIGTATSATSHSSHSSSSSSSQQPLNWLDYAPDQATIDAWKALDLALAQNKPLFNKNQTRFNEYCQQQQQAHPYRTPTKYRFPGPLKRNATLVDRLNHAVRVHWALAFHYRISNIQQARKSAFTVQVGGTDLAMNRIAARLFQVVQQQHTKKEKDTKLVMAFMGTSVMSGQDNCYDVTLAPLLGRKLEAMLGVPVEVRNQGQNGDSPPQDVQLLCSSSTIGVREVDFLHLWYPMMPQAQHAWKDFFLRNWILHPHTRLAHVTQFGPSEFHGLEEYGRLGWMSTANWDPDAMPGMYWVRGGDMWGAVGDGMCHLKTREGIMAVMKQNWHFGPMGFEILSDGLQMLYSAAAIQALTWLVRGEKPPRMFNLTPTQPSSVLQHECEDKCAHRECQSLHQAQSSLYGFACESMQKYKPVVCATSNYPQFHQPERADLDKVWKARSVKQDEAEGAAAPWQRFQNKVLSKINIAKEKTAEGYASRPACSAFKDEGWAYRAQASAQKPTEWLEFTPPESAVDALALGQPPAYKSSSSFVNLAICSGVRAPGKTYETELGPGWVIKLRVYGAQDSKVVEHRQIELVGGMDPVLRSCVMVGRELAKLGKTAGARFAVQFAFDTPPGNASAVLPAPSSSSSHTVIVSNVIMWGV